jgi:hypothetical protein
VLSLRRYEGKGGKRAPKFVPTSNYHKQEEIIKSTKTHYPSNLKPSFNPKREVRKEISKPREEGFVCMFYGCASQMSFASVVRELRRGALTMLQTHIMMSSLIFCLVLTLVLYLISLIDLTITHMVLVHEKTALCVDTLVMTHVIIVVIISYVGPIFLLEGGGPILTLSPDT